MSVVNKMLRDLESRQSAPGGVQAEYQPPAPRRSVWWVFGVLPLGLLLVLGYWLVPQWLDREVKAPPVSVVERPAAVVTNNQAEVPVAPPQATKPELLPEFVQPSEPVAPPVSQNAQPAPAFAEQERPASQGKLSISKPASEQDMQWAGLRERARQALAQNQFESAQKLLAEMLQIRPHQHAVRLRLAELMYGLGQRDSAKQLLQDGVARFEQAPSVRLMLARMLVAEQRQTEALALLKQHQPSILADADYFALRAQLAQQAAELPLAVEDYRLLSQYQPQRVEWRMGLAVSLDQSGEADLAREHYQWLRHSAQLNASLQSFVVQRLNALGGN